MTNKTSNSIIKFFGANKSQQAVPKVADVVNQFVKDFEDIQKAREEEVATNQAIIDKVTAKRDSAQAEVDAAKAATKAFMNLFNRGE